MALTIRQLPDPTAGDGELVSSCPVGCTVKQHKTTNVSVLLSVLYGHQMASLSQAVFLGILLGEGIPGEKYSLSLFSNFFLSNLCVSTFYIC